MKEQLRAFQGEIIKNRHSPIVWITFVAFSLAPLFGGVFMLLMKGEGSESLSGSFKAKAVLMGIESNWASFLSIIPQAVGVGGIIIFGFVASWLFGREYSEGTAKDLLSLPVSRIKILNAKFVYYVLWSLALSVYIFVLGLIIGFALQLPGWSTEILLINLKLFGVTTLLTILLGTPIGFFALWGKGYLAPLGFVVLALVFAQIIAAMGFGTYFPWSIPGIYSGSGGEEFKAGLNVTSYLILILTSLVGYMLTVLWWRYADEI